MKKTFLYLLICIFPFLTNAQTVFKNKQLVHGTWTLENSPYIIQKEAIVPKDKTLVIEAGVKVEFLTGLESDYLAVGNGTNKFDFDLGFLRVEGKIVAQGTSNQKIIFKNYDDEGRYWGVIFLSNSKENIFDHCVFENSGLVKNVLDNFQASAAITLKNSNANISNTIIQNCNHGLDVQQSTLEVNNSIINRMTNSAINSVDSNIAFSNINFVNSEWTLGVWGNTKMIFDKCIFFKNWKDFDPRFLSFVGSVSIKNSAFEIAELPSKIKNGGGNIFKIDPLFTDLKNNNYSLQNDSPLSGRNIGAEL